MRSLRATWKVVPSSTLVIVNTFKCLVNVVSVFGDVLTGGCWGWTESLFEPWSFRLRRTALSIIVCIWSTSTWLCWAWICTPCFSFQVRLDLLPPVGGCCGLGFFNSSILIFSLFNFSFVFRKRIFSSWIFTL